MKKNQTKHILIIDRDYVIARAIELVITGNHLVFVALDKEEALHIMTKHRMDLVIFDADSFMDNYESYSKLNKFNEELEKKVIETAKKIE